METFFLHDRGKSLGVYSCFILLGTVSASTFSGYIVDGSSWPVQFWWNVGLEGLMAVSLFLFVDETTWSRPGGIDYPRLPSGWFARKSAIYFFTARLTPRRTTKETLTQAARPFQIAASPIMVLCGIALMIIFAWSVLLQTFLAIFLQEPVAAGGYGFSPNGNATCKLFRYSFACAIMSLTITVTFASWIGIFIAQAYAIFVNDRLPLAITARFHQGVWHPEVRLHACWIPALIASPIALGLLGACLQYHWHYMVLAVMVVIETYAAIVITPILLNYMIEVFTPAYANEVATVMNFYRLILGLAATFFEQPWAELIGINWVMGTTAFLTIFGCGLILIAVIWGPALRKWNLVNVHSEEESRLVKDH